MVLFGRGELSHPSVSLQGIKLTHPPGPLERGSFSSSAPLKGGVSSSAPLEKGKLSFQSLLEEGVCIYLANQASSVLVRVVCRVLCSPQIPPFKGARGMFCLPFKGDRGMFCLPFKEVREDVLPLSRGPGGCSVSLSRGQEDVLPLSRGPGGCSVPLSRKSGRCTPPFLTLSKKSASFIYYQIISML